MGVFKYKTCIQEFLDRYVFAFVKVLLVIGTAIDLGPTLKAKYTGRTLDGTSFDSNTDGTFSTTLLGVISGWEVLTKFTKGAKVRIFIPSSEGYGTTGSTDPTTGLVRIQPNACLDFDIEIVDVTN